MIIQYALQNDPQNEVDRSYSRKQAQVLRLVSRSWNQATCSAFLRVGKPLLCLRPRPVPVGEAISWTSSDLGKLKQLVKSWENSNKITNVPPFSIYLSNDLFYSRKSVFLLETLLRFGNDYLLELTLSYSVTWFARKPQLPKLPDSFPSLQVLIVQCGILTFGSFPLNNYLKSLLKKSTHFRHFPFKQNWDFDYLSPLRYATVIMNASSPPPYLLPLKKCLFRSGEFNSPSYYFFEQWLNESHWTIGSMLDRNLTESKIPIQASRNMEYYKVTSTTFPVSISDIDWIVGRFKKTLQTNDFPIYIFNVLLAEQIAVPNGFLTLAEAKKVPQAVSSGVQFSFMSQMQLNLEENMLQKVLSNIFEHWTHLLYLKLRIQPSNNFVAKEHQKALEVSLVGARSEEELANLKQNREIRYNFLMQADQQHFLQENWNEYPAGLRNLQKLEIFALESEDYMYSITEICVDMCFFHMPYLKRVELGGKIELMPVAKHTMIKSGIEVYEVIQ